MKILIAEDDKNTRNGLSDLFENEGYITFTAAHGKEAWDLFLKERPDLLCLDIMMPGINGYDLCRKVREEDKQVPILFISAKSEEIDKVLGLEIGADDFIVKPFGVKEVLARVRAVLRRTNSGDSSDGSAEMPGQFCFGDAVIKSGEYQSYLEDTVHPLSERELNLLFLLYSHSNTVVSRDQLFQAGWGVDYYPSSRTLDQHIVRLRKKVEHDPSSPVHLVTVPKIGYKYVSGK